MTEINCEYCDHEQLICCKLIRDGHGCNYNCTRPDGHDGPCVACAVVEHCVASTDPTIQPFTIESTTATDYGH